MYNGRTILISKILVISKLLLFIVINMSSSFKAFFCDLGLKVFSVLFSLSLENQIIFLIVYLMLAIGILTCLWWFGPIKRCSE